MTTLVLCVDRDGAYADPPVVGEATVESLIGEVGTEDPEDSRVNCFLEGLRVTREIRADGEEAVIAVVAGTVDPEPGAGTTGMGEGVGVGVDRAIARQLDGLVDEYRPDAAVVVVDSAADERAVPVIESRVRVDAVDRVIVRQARDLESTYYLLKQFVADEELRSTVLVPLGTALLALPVLLTVTRSVATTGAVVAAVVGVYLLYKGLGVDDLLAGLPAAVREAFYAGQVSLVTYVVGVGLAMVGLFAGTIAVSAQSLGIVVAGLLFVFAGVPWFALAALAAATGRLFDELLAEGSVGRPFLNLPFGVVAIGLVVRGFTGFFLENAAVVGPLTVPRTTVGPVTVDGFVVGGPSRLAAFVIAGIALSLIGVWVAATISGLSVDDRLVDDPDETAEVTTGSGSEDRRG